MGFGDTTTTTGTANLTGARAFVFNNSVGETTFERCVFGTGAHANWCPIWADALTRAYLWKEQQAKMRQDFDRLFSHARDA